MFVSAAIELTQIHRVDNRKNTYMVSVDNAYNVIVKKTDFLCLIRVLDLEEDNRHIVQTERMHRIVISFKKVIRP